jgi:hypothetical protein
MNDLWHGGPAHADDDGNTFCFLSTGSVTATAAGTSSPYLIEIQVELAGSLLPQQCGVRQQA